MTEKLTEIEQQAKEILTFYGSFHQILKCIEEFAELTKELLKLDKQGRVSDINEHIQSEIADCFVMLMQMRELFGRDEVDAWIKRKIERTLKQIEEKKKEWKHD